MRNLPSIIGDLGSLAQMMEEQARELREVAAFFCGGGISASQKPAIATGLMEAMLATPAPAAVVVNRDFEIVEQQPAVRSSASGYPTRPLTADEKAGLCADWYALNPSLRNKTNRLALSRKWRTSPTQFRAVVQGAARKETTAAWAQLVKDVMGVK